MTTSEPMSRSAMMSTALASGSVEVTVYKVLPLTRRMSLTFMVASVGFGCAGAAERVCSEY